MTAAGLAAALVVGALLATQIPPAMARSGRQVQVSQLAAEATAVRGQIDRATGDVAGATSSLSGHGRANTRLTATLSNQAKRLTMLRKQAAELEKEIAALGG